MRYLDRKIAIELEKAAKRNKSVLLLGPRQTGKTTLLTTLNVDLVISLANPELRQRYERNPGQLVTEVEAIKTQSRKQMPLIVIDEVQKVPRLLDAAQDLIDRHIARFILTGSSARKLRRDTDVNLLPGRVIPLRLDPLTVAEIPDADLEDLLIYGSLPSIHLEALQEYREQDLRAYVSTYLEQEVRSEAIVRNLGAFSRFLELACAESGRIINFTKLSQDVGVAHTTIRAYYEVLEDCLVAERVEPIFQSETRKKLARSQRYLIFDMGVRRVAANEGDRPSLSAKGTLFEQWVGLELIRLGRQFSKSLELKFWRDPNGPEVDWVIVRNQTFVPIEVKWTDTPKERDIKYLQVFLNEYSQATHAYLVCRAPRRMKLAQNIEAIPWQEIASIVENL